MNHFRVLLVTAAALFAACGDDAVAPAGLAGRYVLVSFLGHAPPITTDSVLVSDAQQPAGVRCANTLVSDEITLARDLSASRVVQQEMRCADGSVRAPRTSSMSGSFETMSDSVRITFIVSGSTVGRFSWDLLRSGNRLLMPSVRYTEANPDAGPVEYVIWEKR